MSLPRIPSLSSFWAVRNLHETRVQVRKLPERIVRGMFVIGTFDSRNGEQKVMEGNGFLGLAKRLLVTVTW